MIYRVMQRLATGPNRNVYVEPGSPIRADRFPTRTMQILLKKQAIAPISAPPLDALRGWKLRAKRFTAAGYDAFKFLEADDRTVADATGYNVKSIAKWRKELEELLLLGGETVTGGCVKC